jgi:hypothetical protein
LQSSPSPLPPPFHQPKILTAKAYITNTVLFCPPLLYTPDT